MCKRLVRGVVVGAVLVVMTAMTVGAFDTDLLKSRLAPRTEALDVGADALRVDRALWKSDLDRSEARHSEALHVSQTLAVRQAERWIQDFDLKKIDRFRKEGLSLSPARLSNPMGGDINLSLNVSEKLRLRMAATRFTRDLLYDPLKSRVWMDLYRMDMPDRRASLTLTNTYRFDEDAADLMLKLNRSFE